jgi:DNA-binding NarL/FixJ family response regulator
MQSNGSVEGEPVRVLLAVDDERVRHRLARLLDEQSDIDVVGETSTDREAVECVARLDPDVVLMDCRVPPTSELARLLARGPERHPPRVVLFAVSGGSSTAVGDEVVVHACPRDALFDVLAQTGKAF